MKKMEDVLGEFYRKKIIEEKLEYEIGILKNTNNNINKYLEIEPNSEFAAKISINEKAILDKEIELSEIKTNMATLDYVIRTLDEQNRNLIELKYKEKKEYKEIVDTLNISKSTIIRRINVIMNMLEDLNVLNT